MAAIDVAGFIADLKDHAADHGFHVHDERHFVETYSLRQLWEVDLHPEEACGGPLVVDVEPVVDRVVLEVGDEPGDVDGGHGLSLPRPPRLRYRVTVPTIRW